jgi:hypothetical protein
MNDNPREHLNLYYIFLEDKQNHPPPEGHREALFALLFGQKGK